MFDISIDATRTETKITLTGGKNGIEHLKFATRSGDITFDQPKGTNAEDCADRLASYDDDDLKAFVDRLITHHWGWKQVDDLHRLMLEKLYERHAQSSFGEQGVAI